jgi:hypothetical protein
MRYEALSYAWSDSGKLCQIEIFSSPSIGHVTKERTAILPIAVNLYHALQGLHYSDKPRTFWIDALCINQINSQEREEQVLQMREVYSRAHQTIVWLGDGDE